jgi:bifunctional DNA-binding transcriptional regulator/antitoxin component of YhaV-PrlF toxin-antitoxin module
MLAGGPTEHRPMHQVVAGLKTKSAKIRALAREGYSRADIARFLEIRYQHVRNVLVQSSMSHGREQIPDQVKATLGPAGRILIPAPYRQVLGLEEGAVVVMRLEGDTLRLESRNARLNRAQKRVTSRLVDPQFSADSFLAERRREAEQEGSDG